MVETWQTPPAIPVPELAVDDHRGRLEPLLRRPLSGRPVERERLARADQLAVDQVGHELDVVDPVRVAAIDRLVAPDQADDAHPLRLLGRARRRQRANRDVGNAVVRGQEGGHDRLLGRLQLDQHARPVGNDADVLAHAPGRVPRLTIDGARQPLEPLLLTRASEAERCRAVGGKVEDRGDLPARQPPPRRAEPQPDWRREGGLHLVGRVLQVVFGHRLRVDPDRKRDRRAALERPQGADEHVRRFLAVENLAVLARDDFRLEPAELYGGVAVRPVDVMSDQRQLVGERRVPRLHRRRDLRTEQANLQPLQAAQRPEAAAAIRGGGDRRVPVDLDAEPRGRDLEAVVPGDEDHRDVLELRRAALEQRFRVRGSHPADVDARYLDAVRDPVGRAREGKADDAREQHQQDRDQQRPSQGELMALRLSPTTPR